MSCSTSDGQIICYDVDFKKVGNVTLYTSIVGVILFFIHIIATSIVCKKFSWNSLSILAISGIIVMTIYFVYVLKAKVTKVKDIPGEISLPMFAPPEVGDKYVTNMARNIVYIQTAGNILCLISIIGFAVYSKSDLYGCDSLFPWKSFSVIIASGAVILLYFLIQYARHKDEDIGWGEEEGEEFSNKAETDADFESKSQFNQDYLALKHNNFKRNGTYLEIGVHDGEEFNNTFLMDKDYGWTGVCIDPAMHNMARRTAQQFNCALGSEPGETEFCDGGPLSGTKEFVQSMEHNSMWADRAADFVCDKKVQVRTPLDILTESKLPNVIDYMSLDIEGGELDVMSAFPFDKYCVKYSTIETNDDPITEKKLEVLLGANGYAFEGHIGVDHVFTNTCDGFT